MTVNEELAPAATQYTSTSQGYYSGANKRDPDAQRRDDTSPLPQLPADHDQLRLVAPAGRAKKMDDPTTTGNDRSSSHQLGRYRAYLLPGTG